VGSGSRLNEDDGSGEPSLGAIETSGSAYGGDDNASGCQLDWGLSDCRDLEDERHGREPDEDGEPLRG